MQGEMIQAKFGLVAVAERQLETYSTAVLLATESPPKPPRSATPPPLLHMHSSCVARHQVCCDFNTRPSMNSLHPGWPSPTYKLMSLINQPHQLVLIFGESANVWHEMWVDYFTSLAAYLLMFLSFLCLLVVLFLTHQPGLCHRTPQAVAYIPACPMTSRGPVPCSVCCKT